MAGAIAGAGARTLIQGADFGDNLMAVLPDVIGSTLGNLFADSVETNVTAAELGKTGMNPELAYEFAAAKTTGNVSYLMDTISGSLGVGADMPSYLESLGAAGQSAKPNEETARALAVIASIDQDLAVMAKYDPDEAKALARVFHVARLAMDSYASDGVNTGLLPKGFVRQTAQNHDAVFDKFDFSDLNTKEGYAAALYTDADTHGYILVDRGTEHLADPWVDGRDNLANGLNVLGRDSPEFDQAVAVARTLAATLKSTPLTFAGHSLGGGLAIAQALATKKLAIVFNSESPSRGTLQHAGVSLTKDQLHNEIFNSNRVQAYSTFLDPVGWNQAIGPGAEAAHMRYMGTELKGDSIFDGPADSTATYLASRPIIKSMLPADEQRKPLVEIADDIEREPPINAPSQIFKAPVWGLIAYNHSIPSVLEGMDAYIQHMNILNNYKTNVYHTR